MPGLFGVIAKTDGLSGRVLRSLAMRMADSMRHLPWLRVEIWGDERFCGGRVHLGVLNPSSQPMVNEDLTRVWFDGELYPSPSTTGTTPTAENVLNLVAGSGTNLSEVDGVFALACFDPKKRELTLANDRLGYRPLYYTETEEWFAYAAEVKTLLAIRDKTPDLDEISLRQFLGFGHMLGERTWWNGIELIPPAVVWRLSPKGRTKHRYWTFAEIKREPAPESEVHEEFARLWSQAVKQRVKPGKMPLLLSGGLDSRLLLAELREQGVDVAGITFGDAASADMKIAKQCACLAEIEHRSLPLTRENWWHGREEAIWQTDGLNNLIDLHASIAKDEMHSGNFLSHLNLAGDTLFGGSKLEGVASKDWQSDPQNLLNHLYLENPLFSKDEVTSVSMADAERYLDGPSSDCFIFRQRQRRCILYGALQLASHSEMVFPGVSLPLIRLILGSVRDEQRVMSGFYNRFLVTYYPTYFRNIPWTTTGRGLAEPFSMRIWRGVESGFSALLGNNNKHYDGSFANYSKFLHFSKVKERLLSENLILDDCLHGAARRAVNQCHVNDSDRPYASGAYALAGILTVETYLRQVSDMPSVSSLQP